MDNNQESATYNFESQLELGELLLGMGRVEDAERELRKANVLNEAGAFRSAEDSPERAEYLARLATALTQVESVLKSKQRRDRILYWIGTGALALLLAGFFTAWVMQRSEFEEMEDSVNVQATILASELAAMDRSQQNIVVQEERYVEMIQDLSAELTVSAIRLKDRNEFIDTLRPNIPEELEDEIPESETVSEFPTPDPAIIVPDFEVSEEGVVTKLDTPTPEPLSKQELVVTTDANIRSRPGLAFSILGVTYRNENVEVLAQSEDGFWYNIISEQGVNGWVHISLVKPKGYEQLPIVKSPTDTPVPTNTPVPPTNTFVPPTNTFVPATNVPPTSTPIIVPTSTSIPIAVVPTAIPVTNTAIPNTAVPTAIPPTNTAVPTAIPPTNTFVPNTAVPTAIPPTNTFVPNTVVPTAILPTNTFVPSTAVPTAIPVINTDVPNTDIPDTTVFITNTPEPTVLLDTIETTPVFVPTNTSEPFVQNTPTLVPTTEFVENTATAVPVSSDTTGVDPLPPPSTWAPEATIVETSTPISIPTAEEESTESEAPEPDTEDTSLEIGISPTDVNVLEERTAYPTNEEDNGFVNPLNIGNALELD